MLKTMFFFCYFMLFNFVGAITFTEEQLHFLEENNLPLNGLSEWLESLPVQLRTFEMVMTFKENLSFLNYVFRDNENNYFSDFSKDEIDMPVVSFLVENNYALFREKINTGNSRQKTFETLQASTLFQHKRSFQESYDKCEKQMLDKHILNNPYPLDKTKISYEKMAIPSYDKNNEVPSGTLLYYGSLIKSPKWILKKIRLFMANGKKAVGDDSISFMEHIDCSLKSPWNATTWSPLTAFSFASGMRNTHSSKVLVDGAVSFILIIDSSDTITQKLLDSSEREVVVYRKIPGKNILGAIVFNTFDVNDKKLLPIKNAEYYINKYAKDPVDVLYVMMNLSFDLKFEFLKCLYEGQ